MGIVASITKVVSDLNDCDDSKTSPRCSNSGMVYLAARGAPLDMLGVAVQNVFPLQRGCKIMVFDQIFLLALESLIPQALCCLKQPHLVEHKVIQPSGPLGQQPGDGLGNGVTSYRMAKHPAVVLVQRCDVEPHCARLALIGGNIPAMQQAQHATFFDAAICARVVLDELDNGCSYQFAGSRTTRYDREMLLIKKQLR
ncbi:MAG: hypothetical protein FRX49_10574 [Trebouxia sp. A1-2]|nr:MAG: hypothetical protein FRX49_10574 [Trebouxia sp. A1-2]